MIDDHTLNVHKIKIHASTKASDTRITCPLVQLTPIFNLKAGLWLFDHTDMMEYDHQLGRPT
ncbi:unnamed protein product [marine sediment metagenome]|uniref:Uncharacterized protein n=1 Tax=marine sediment metagenome TaxID=412755 RepID=X1DKI4_9ZZZZ